MLDRSKLLRELQQVTPSLFNDYSAEYEIARKVWQQITSDGAFALKARAAHTTLNTPTWLGPLDQATPIPPITDYCALAVDGSQIYPDRHQGVACYLINIGSVAITYGGAANGVQLDSKPHLFVGERENELPVTPDFVNCRRDAFEFAAGCALSAECARKQHAAIPQLLLLDGSLIFWHLAAKEIEFQKYFVSQYVQSLQTLYEARSLCASYISLPKNKEVSNLIRLAVSNYDTSNAQAIACVAHLLDTAVARFYLEPGMHSAVFAHTSTLTALYPEHLRPHFIYLHVGTEVARVEFPAWIAQDAQAVATVAQIVFDQCAKGNGYPVVLAEAHEQAVVKGGDREFFYHVLAKIGIEQKQRMAISQKSLKKRGIGI